MNSNSAVKPDDGGKLMIDEFQAMRQQMAQLLDVIAVQQQQNIGLASRMEELSKQVHANSQISPPPSPIPQNSQDEASAPMKVMMDEVAVPALKQQLLEEDVDLDEIKRRSEQLANLLLAKGISPPASLLSITPPPSLPSADPQPIPEEGKMADVTAVNRPARPGAPPEPNPPQIPTSKPEAKNPTMKWKPSPKSVVVASTPQSQDATVNPQRNDWTPSANPVLRRIATARRWQDLQALVDRQPKGLDAVAVASAFTRLPSLLKSYEIDQEVNDFASQLLQLLQLQLQSLPNSSLASVLGACSSIPGVSASHPSWLTGAVRAVAIKMKRMTLSEISGCLLGLNSLGAEPNEEWTAELLKEVQLRLKADGSVALEDLGLVLRSIADIRSETKPDASWMKDFEATCTSLSATFQPSTSSLKGIVGLIIGSHKLKSDLDPDMYIAALKTALGLTGSPSALNQAIQLLQTSLTAQELVDLTSGIASPQSDPSLLSAIAEATWPKLSQLSAATSLTLFDTLVAARYDFPPAMLASFSNRLTSSESLDLMSSGDIVALLSTLASISSSSLQPSSLETVQDVMMTKGLGLAKSTSRLDPDTLTSLLSSLSCLGAAVKPSLLTAVFRDIRPQLKSLQPSTFSLMASSLGRLEVNIDIDFVEAVVEDLMERAMELDVLTGSPTSVVLINGLASMNVKPRSSLLGPLLASTMDTAPLLPPADIISLLNAIASLKLKREETQGVLKATSPGGSPSPQDFVSCLLSSLKSSNFDLLTVKQVASIASHLKALSDPLNGSARHSPPPPEWTNEFLSSFSRKLNGASTDSIVLILSTLPSLSKGQGHAVPEGFVRACLSHIEASMDEMELEELCEIVEAATFSSGDAAEEAEYIDATFISALASTAQTLVGSKVHDVSSLSRFSCALARANIAPSPQLLNLIVSSSAAHVKAAKDGLSSASSSHRSIALLLWGVSQLARNTSMLLPSGPDAGSFVDQKWLDDIIVCINRTITSSRFVSLLIQTHLDHSDLWLYSL